MRDFFEQAFTSSETLGSHVEEGDFVTAVRGVEAFPCTLPSRANKEPGGLDALCSLRHSSCSTA